jgi:acetyltransferase-like isoleucine patch superfamily enzyme
MSIVLDRMRSIWWRSLGAEIAPKVAIGRRSEVTRPKQLAIDTRSVIEPDVVFKLVRPHSRIRIGANVFIGRGTIFDIEGECCIGDGTLIAPHCFITDHNHGTAADTPIWQQACVTENVTFGAGVWLGAKVIILPGVMIGDGAVVAAGAVVTGSVAAKVIVAGLPARFLRERK